MVLPFSWAAAGTKIALLTTELNSLANGTITAAGPEINNSSGYQLGMLSIHMASAVFVAPSYCNVYFVTSNDTNGTTYPTVTSAAAWAGANYLVGTIYINGSTAVQNETLPYVPIPLGKFKTYLVTGGSCPTLAATLNTLDLYPTPSQY